jgi:hypothetical protein
VNVSAATALSDIVGTSIVLVGPCNPMFLQPSFLIENGLISDADIMTLRYDVLANEIAVAHLSWMQIVAEPNKLTVTTTLQSPAGEPIRDFVLGFSELLPNKQFVLLGINRDQHFGVQDEEVWHKIGHRLAPKEELWRKVLREPGMRTLSVQGKRDDQYVGHILVKVEPSGQIKPGIYVSVNDHYQLDPDQAKTKSGQLLDALANGWDMSMRRADEVVAALKDFAA